MTDVLCVSEVDDDDGSVTLTIGTKIGDVIAQRIIRSLSVDQAEAMLDDLADAFDLGIAIDAVIERHDSQR
jgi:hypothetical protein